MNTNENLACVEVFDFRRNWHLVRPHLPAAERALERGIESYFNEFPGASLGPDGARKKYDPNRGPWFYSRYDCWAVTILDQMNAAIERGDFKWKWPGEDADDATLEQSQREYEAYESRFYPKPDSPEWYQAYGLCHWLVGWLLVLGKRIFPHLVWKPYRGELHSFAAGFDQTGNLRIIFDILFFEEMTAKELIDAVRKRSKARRSPRRPTKFVGLYVRTCGGVQLLLQFTR